jgi:hypothetical protein
VSTSVNLCVALVYSNFIWFQLVGLVRGLSLRVQFRFVTQFGLQWFVYRGFSLIYWLMDYSRSACIGLQWFCSQWPSLVYSSSTAAIVWFGFRWEGYGEISRGFLHDWSSSS